MELMQFNIIEAWMAKNHKLSMNEFPPRYVLFGCHQLTELGDVQEMWISIKFCGDNNDNQNIYDSIFSSYIAHYINHQFMTSINIYLCIKGEGITNLLYSWIWLVGQKKSMGKVKKVDQQIANKIDFCLFEGNFKGKKQKFV